jgi:hypothetical protein
MASRKTRRTRSERRFTVEGVRREPPDTRKLAKALLAVVLAERQHEARPVMSTDGSGE